MKLFVIGTNHRVGTVIARERALAALGNRAGILLSTCNRVELYTDQKLDDALIANRAFYYYKDQAVVRHLFRVAAGLDSQILGESQILGQVKEAYLKQAGKFSFLDSVFETALRVGRRVRSETGISRGNASIASVAVAKVKQHLKSKESKKIVLIGAGKVVESVLKILLKLKFSFIFVANRTYGKAVELARQTGGKAVRFSALKRELIDTDLVISSTSAPHIVLTKEQVKERNKPLVVIDLAGSRDVDPEIANMAGIRYLNIDDIKEQIGANLLRRKLEALFAESIIEAEVKKFCERFALEPVAVV